jgi:hypothetical protein
MVFIVVPPWRLWLHADHTSERDAAMSPFKRRRRGVPSL